MTIDEVIALLDTRESTALSDLQRLILQQSWAGKTYPEIAEGSHYEPTYLKNVARGLWHSLSEYFGKPINKANLQANLAERPLTDNEQQLTICDRSQADYPLESPRGAVPLNSVFYVKHSAVEDFAWRMVSSGGFIRIVAPRLMGKCSFLLRLEQRAVADGCRVASVDFQQAELSALESLEPLLRWFCASISHQLGYEIALDEYWDGAIGSKMSCTHYVRDYLLKQSDSRLFLTIHNIDYFFKVPHLAQELALLFGSWQQQSGQFEKLCGALAYSLPISQDPTLAQLFYRLGIPISLPSFSLDQIIHLAKLHGLAWMNRDRAEQLQNLVGSNPYVIRLALYHLAQSGQSLAQFCEDSITLLRLYYLYLHKGWLTLQSEPNLAAAFVRFALADGDGELDLLQEYALTEKGLVWRKGKIVHLSCPLYRLYLAAKFSNSEDVNLNQLESDRSERNRSERGIGTEIAVNGLLQETRQNREDLNSQIHLLRQRKTEMRTQVDMLRQRRQANEQQRKNKNKPILPRSS